MKESGISLCYFDGISHMYCQVNKWDIPQAKPLSNIHVRTWDIPRSMHEGSQLVSGISLSRQHDGQMGYPT
jgi:hypothetical protein